MRRYLAAGVIGVLLVAGQAAASDDAAVNPGDRVGAPADAGASNFEGSELLILLGWVAVTAGLAAWGVTSENGAPASP